MFQGRKEETSESMRKFNLRSRPANTVTPKTSTKHETTKPSTKTTHMTAFEDGLVLDQESINIVVEATN